MVMSCPDIHTVTFSIFFSLQINCTWDIDLITMGNLLLFEWSYQLYCRFTFNETLFNCLYFESLHPTLPWTDTSNTWLLKKSWKSFIAQHWNYYIIVVADNYHWLFFLQMYWWKTFEAQNIQPERLICMCILSMCLRFVRSEKGNGAFQILVPYVLCL